MYAAFFYTMLRFYTCEAIKLVKSAFKSLKHTFYCFLCPRRDSNSYLQNRNLKFYPLNYGDCAGKNTIFYLTLKSK